MSVFEAVVEALFADPHLARDAVYTAEGGAPALVRAFTIRGEPIRDRERSVWTVELRPA